ncbi:MAG: hypothetical protein P1P84_00900 [Deferrisomatales bacterium]|nr:hypothetical protein [Deferrisomatales bacterium]
MKGKIGVVVSAALLFGSAQAALAADPVATGSDKVKVKLYGQVNRAALIVSDGDETNYYFVDNDASSTRLGIKAESKAEGDLSFGLKFEVQMESNSTASVGRGNDDDGGASFTERHMDVYAKHKRFGTLSLGQGDTASNGSAEVDLSGTSLAGYSDISTFAGGQYFWDNSAEALSGVKVKDVFKNYDGLSRRDRVRYDSPSLFGFTLSGSLVQEDRCDVALRYTGKVAGLKIEAAVAHAYEGTAARTEANSGSISVLHDSGINLTVASAKQVRDQSGREDPTYFYGKLGYQRKFSDLGKTAFSVDYGVFNDVKQDDDEAKVFGVQLVQKLDEYGTELYAGYRSHDLDRKGGDFDTISGFLAGARVKF